MEGFLGKLAVILVMKSDENKKENLGVIFNCLVQDNC